MTDSTFPFGTTDVSPDRIRELVDLNQAISIADDGSVIDAESRLRRFIQQVPDLLVWLEKNGRDYPWRNSSDPYRVYVTEILLQRTRGDAVNDIYDDFFTQFSTPQEIHDADEEVIRDTVRSLGFVNHRTRTLQEVSELICEDHDGDVPDDLATLEQPWRVGPYSSRACQLFARGHPFALVDSNFARVIGRVLGYEMPQQPHKSDEVYALMDALVPAESALARSFNLAILDLGALICTPSSPSCVDCPLQQACHYYETEVES